MLDFIETTAAIKVLYKHFKEEVDTLDFFELPIESYPHLYESPDQQWYMLNPQKLKKEYMTQSEGLIVNQDQKNSLLKAVLLIKNYSEKLPSSSFLERLLYCKKMLPPCFYENDDIKEKSNTKVHPLQNKKKKDFLSLSKK